MERLIMAEALNCKDAADNRGRDGYFQDLDGPADTQMHKQEHTKPESRQEEAIPVESLDDGSQSHTLDTDADGTPSNEPDSIAQMVAKHQHHGMDVNGSERPEVDVEGIDDIQLSTLTEEQRKIREEEMKVT